MPGSDDSLEDLMGAYAAGDEAAFAELHRRVAGRLYGFFLRGGCSPQLAHDLAQQTFLRVHVARGRYHLGAPVLPWLFTIAYRVRVDEARRRGRRPESSLEPEEQQRLKAPEPEQPSDLAHALREAVQSLPDGQREVVVLHKFEGLSMAEVADVVGSTESAVKVRAHRAYKALKKVLEPLMERGHES